MKPENTELDHLKYLEELLEAQKQRVVDIELEKEIFFDNDFANGKQTKKLSIFFMTHGLAIVELETANRSADYYKVAKKIWAAKEVLIPFIRKIPYCLKTRSFDYCTEHLSILQHNRIRNFCKFIQDEKGWFSFKDNKTSIHIDLSKSNKYIQFFNGGWAEQVCLYLIDKALNSFTKENKVRKKLFWNVKLKHFGSPYQHDMELDLVVQIKDKFYIFEVKSGYALAIDKWVDRSRQFSADNSQYITCTSDENLNPKIFQPYTLFALATLEEQFMEMLRKDFSPE